MIKFLFFLLVIVLILGAVKLKQASKLVQVEVLVILLGLLSLLALWLHTAHV